MTEGQKTVYSPKLRLRGIMISRHKSISTYNYAIKDELSRSMNNLRSTLAPSEKANWETIQIALPQKS